MKPARMTAACVLLLAACAGPGQTRQVETMLDRGTPRSSAAASTPAEADAASDRQVHIDLIRRMLEQKQYYAALAHIESQQRLGNTDELRLLEADARRQLGQVAVAQPLYLGLLKTRYNAQAYHGLGLIYATSNPTQSLAYLKQAVQLSPTSTELRNDYGYALMLARRYPEALPQLSTAIELDPASDKSRNNLIILMLLMRDEPSVQRIVRDANVDAQTLAGLRKRAQSLATPPRPATAPKPTGAG